MPDSIEPMNLNQLRDYWGNEVRAGVRNPHEGGLYRFIHEQTPDPDAPTLTMADLEEVWADLSDDFGDQVHYTVFSLPAVRYYQVMHRIRDRIRTHPRWTNPRRKRG
jgi:hypothetical protein